MADTTTDHEKIRGWAESRGGKPAAVKKTHHGKDVRIIYEEDSLFSKLVGRDTQHRREHGDAHASRR